MGPGELSGVSSLRLAWCMCNGSTTICCSCGHPCSSRTARCFSQAVKGCVPLCCLACQFSQCVQYLLFGTVACRSSSRRGSMCGVLLPQ